MKKSNKGLVRIILLGVLMLSYSSTAESGDTKGINKFSDSKNYYDGIFHNHHDVKLASPPF